MEILVEGQLDYFEEKSWKKRYFVMKYEISSALRYIEIYKDKNWQRQLPRHVVNLHPGYEVRRREEPKKKHCFSVKTTDHTLLLSCDDENVVTHWMATLEEYNLVKSFCVQPQDTPTMVRIEAVLPCHLQLVHSEVRLVSAMDGKLLGLWPFKCIRRYKFVGNLFSIEAGRKAPTGEGVFEFISNECAEIYRVMDTIIRTKAGSTTMQRLASEKLHKQVGQVHHPIRKVDSVPVSPTKNEPRYEYADPTTTSRPPPPHVPLPKPPPPPIESPPELPLDKTEPTYDILSPGIEGTVNKSDAKLTKPSEPALNESEYNTLQFTNAWDVVSQAQVPNRKPMVTGSPGSYDTLRFSTSPDTSSTGHDFIKGKAKDGGYDTLQFGRDTFSHHVEDAPEAKKDSELSHSSGSFYNTLDHSSPSQTSGSVPYASNTYDTLDAGKRPPLGGPDTYDSLGNTSREVTPPSSLDLGNTYDAIQQETPKPTGKSSPVQGSSPPRPSIPVRPPPRKKVPSFPRQPDVPVRKIPAGGKPEKPFRRNVSSKDEPRQSISDVIQKRLAMQKSVDEGKYSSTDHEYTPVDYSKVSTSEGTNSDIYTDPDQDDSRGTITKPSKPTKTPRNPPAITESTVIYTDPDQDDSRGTITKPSKPTKTPRNPPAITESTDIYTDPDQDDSRGTISKPSKPTKTPRNPPATTESTDIYTDPDQDDSRGTITKPCKPTKTRRNPPAITESTDIYTDPDQDDSRGTITKPSKPTKTRRNPPAITESTDIYTDPDQDDSRGTITKPSKPTKTRRNPPATTESADIYTDPDQDDSRGTAVTKPVPKPAKPTWNIPRPGRNFFKKTSSSPKPKIDTESSFADELKKKLEIKLKKTGGPKPPASIPVPPPDNDDIYCEVAETDAPTYSEPCV